MPGFNFNVDEWDAKGLSYETLAIRRTLALPRAAFAATVAERPAGRFMIRNRIRVVKRHPEGDWIPDRFTEIFTPTFSSPWGHFIARSP